MNIFGLLNAVSIPIFSSGADVSLDWLGNIVKFLIDGIGIVGVGIIVFTLIIKTIVLPLDIYQKVTTRKQSLKMEAMRPQLEKLQKQYANDQQLYNQKMMELYKQNNYSMVAACIPAIVMMIIFFWVFAAFNSYSQYTNLHAYNVMIEKYNSAILSYSVTLEEKDGMYYVTGDYTTETVVGSDGIEYIRFIPMGEDKFIYVEVGQHYVTDNAYPADLESADYCIDTEKMLQNSKIASEVNAVYAARETDDEVDTMEDACLKWVRMQGRAAAADSFESNKISFLWIKNIWYADTMFAHPVQSYDSFVSSINRKIKIDGTSYNIKEYPNSPYKTSAAYNEITHDLSDRKGEANGYFILIVLSVGTMFLSQFVMSKMQKAQTELQTVNGQGASSMKMMMIMMPIVYGFFSFSYSSSFAIYMITSNVYGLLTSLLTSKLVEWSFKKAEERALQNKYSKRINAVKKK